MFYDYELFKNVLFVFMFMLIIFIGSGPNQLNTPIGIAIDNHGSLYVEDSNNNRIMKFPTTKKQLHTSPAGTVVPEMCMPRCCLNFRIRGAEFRDKHGNRFVADYCKNRVIKFRPNDKKGEIIAGTGVRGTGPNQLNYPLGVFINPIDGMLYVADTLNHRIMRWLICR